MQGLTGLAEITGEASGGPCRVGSPVIDLGTGMWSAMGILALLTRRAQTGVGGIVDTSLYETGLAWMTLHSALYMATGELPARSGLRGPMLAPNGGYRASDGILMIVCGTQGQFERLCQVIGADALIDDPRFATTQSRHTHHDDLAEMLEDVLSGDTRANWAEKLNSVDIPNAPVTTINEMLVHPQTEASGMLQALPSNRGKVMGLPIRFDGERPHPAAGASALGAFNAQLHTLIDPGLDAAND
jgi:crotonobetainyl-CoA:carnitine CoA-transferase CaiB-like acyl-CoA transferase